MYINLFEHIKIFKQMPPIDCNNTLLSTAEYIRPQVVQVTLIAFFNAKDSKH